MLILKNRISVLIMIIINETARKFFRVKSFIFDRGYYPVFESRYRLIYNFFSTSIFNKTLRSEVLNQINLLKKNAITFSFSLKLNLI